MAFSSLVLLLAVTSPQPPELRLSEVLADVEAHAPALLADKARAEALQRAVDATGWWDEPYLAVGPDEVTFLPDEMPMLRYQLSQRIPFPGKTGAREDAAKARAATGKTNVDVTARSLRVAATQLFVRAIFLEEAARTNAELAQVLRDVKASAEARYMTGGTAHHDALLADAEIAILKRDMRALERSRRVAFIQLDELRGHIGERRGELPLLVDDVAAVPPASFDEAIAAQPELARAKKNVDAASSDARVLGLARLPDVTVQLMAMQSFMEEEPSNVGAMVGVALPLYFPWKQDAAADAAERSARAAQVDVDALTLRLRAEWDAAREELASAEDTAKLYEEQILPSTKLALDASMSAYASQQAPLVELLSIARNEAQTRLEARAAQLDVRLAKLRLAELVAQPQVLRLAPQSPTLFGGMGGSSSGAGMGGMGGSSSMGGMGGSAPINMGDGMTPGLVGGGESGGGMEGM
jgi:outer membrane protein TolC